MPSTSPKHCCFIERGLASIVALNGHRHLEVGLIGPEGMTGLAIVLGNDRPPHENPISAENVREAMQQRRSLERVFLDFAHSFMNQTANTALSNGTATIEESAPAAYGQ